MNVCMYMYMLSISAEIIFHIGKTFSVIHKLHFSPFSKLYLTFFKENHFAFLTEYNPLFLGV